MLLPLFNDDFGERFAVTQFLCQARAFFRRGRWRSHPGQRFDQTGGLHLPHDLIA